MTFDMDLKIGDHVFYTGPTGLCVPPLPIFHDTFHGLDANKLHWRNMVH